MVQILDVSTSGPPRTPGAGTDPDTNAARTLRDVLALRPGWPVVLLFVGYPLWWVLGIPDVVGIVAAGAMLVSIVNRRSLRLPNNFGLIALFVLWVVLSFALIGVAAPGAVAATDPNRALTAGYRLLWYLKAILLLLYLGNERERLSQTWICRTLGWMFCWIVAGGLLGVIAPAFEFRSLLELVLPHGLATTPFVYANIHPVAAEGFADYLGGSFRTSAPFPYANVWGLNFACFLPFFVIGWLGRDAGRRRVAGWIVLIVSIVPVVLSLNRGLWIAIGAAVLVVAVRAVFAGRLRVIGFGVGAALLVGAIIAVSPLGSAIGDRLNSDAPSSATTRSNLTTLTFDAVRDGSPLVGFGATRNVQGNFDSIAGGATSTCRRCVVPALGTQGQLLFVTFTQGFVGAVLYFGFLLLQFFRYVRVRSKYVDAALAVLIAHFVTSLVYSADNLALLPIFAAVALLWREGEVVAPGVVGRGFLSAETTAGQLARSVARRWKPIVALVVAGLLIGGLVALLRGPTERATASLYISDDPTYPVLQPLPSTPDSVARLATSAVALSAMRAEAGTDAAVKTGQLSVTATPNTRILHLVYSSHDDAQSKAIVRAAARTVLRLHQVELAQEQQQVMTRLQDQSTSLSTSLLSVRAAARKAGQPRAVLAQVDDLQTQLRRTGKELSTVAQLSTYPGQVVGDVTIARDRDAQLIDLVNGVGIAILLVAAYVGLSRLGGRRPVVDGVLVCEVRQPLDVFGILQRTRPGAVVAVASHAASVDAARVLDEHVEESDRRELPVRVLLVALGSERERAIARAGRMVERAGGTVTGVVVRDRRRRHGLRGRKP